ncbi:MAG: CHAD domain-containing protein [Lentisphaerae bacterium]|jgi:CHAD domain-containing protein|nr:CHAD domain-containing protein [Lentisphaerota bacterium]MBT5608790.1 CHAD domain-containing protein [Lentisphaerota bacterium]MBT7058301.1 CHAD domain-containing protein [Lentisphaerota bacterium]MBT7840276.1 CHAD domain-containing protein [Lentisphaerota bacterium]
MSSLTIDRLCRRFRNEDPHTLHVARLGLDLFDRVGGALGLPDTARSTLEVACRLHDLGYSVRPTDHARASADLLLTHGVDGISSSEVAVVAGAILLHGGKCRRALSVPLVADSPSRELILQLGALLRVADGLDHGHIQNASIVSARCVDDGVHVEVAGQGYSGNVPWASRKADLWQIAFGGRLTIEDVEPPGSPGISFEGIVRSGDGELEGVRRLLYSQFRAMDENRAGAIAALSPVPLHDLRVANRRFRAAIRLFRRQLAPLAANELSERFSTIADGLGEARDLDVWLTFLRNLKANARMASTGRWEAFLDGQESRRRKSALRLGAALESSDSIRVMQDAAFLLRVILPERLRECASPPISPFLARNLRRVLKRLRLAEKGVKRGDAEGMHGLRKKVRRYRYWAEFAAPILGDEVQELVRRLKCVADALGDIHDADVHSEMLVGTGKVVQRGLRKALKVERRQAVHLFSEAWGRLQDRPFRRALKRALRERM